MARKIENRIQKRRSVTLIGEGITEQYYFTHIRTLFGYHYTIKPYYFSVTSLVEMDKKIAEAIQDGGFAIAIFDADVASWFLLHYENTNRFFKDSAATEKALRKYIPDYEKKEKFLQEMKWVSDLCADEKLESAKTRAEAFGHTGDSYSEIYRAFDFFKAMQG